jgi:outer membrane murein-binding lipoprotein Lpp
VLKEIHSQISRALTDFKLNLARSGIGAKTYLVLVFLVLLAGNVMAFNYYQARMTRYYLHILYMNVVRMNADIDTLDAKLNKLNAVIDGLSPKVDQLNAKTDALNTKLDKQALPPPTSLVPPPHKCTGIFC